MQLPSRRPEVWMATQVGTAQAPALLRADLTSSCASAVNQLFDAWAQAKYSSVDLLMRATFSRDSIWDDLGVTQQPMRQSISSTLGRLGWNMVCRSILSTCAMRLNVLFLVDCITLSR